MSPKTVPNFKISYGGSRFWYTAGFILAGLVLAVSTYLALGGELLGWEQRLFMIVNNWPDSWRYVFLVVTALGSSWMAAVSVGAIFLAKMYWLAWRLAVSVLVGYGAVFFLKFWVDRPRPEGLITDAHIRTAESFAGFPSGHAMLITVLSLSLLPYLPKMWRWFIVVPFVALVVLSRLYLGVHVPLDIIGGVALGVFIVCLIRILPGVVRKALRLGQ